MVSQVFGSQDSSGGAHAIAGGTPTEDDGACWSWTAGFQVGNCIRLAVAGVGETIVKMVSIVLVLVNELFNVVVQISIRDFASYANQDGVNNAWKAVRDVVNIAFIFILMYVAIGAMFNLFDYKRVLVRVIVVALLINFSALVPKIVIDTSNLLALEFYNGMGDGETYTGAPAVTHAIVSGLGLWDNADGFWDRVKSSEDERSPDPLIGKLSLFGIIGATYGKIALILVTSFVLAMAAWLFIVRTVVLLFLIILSPIAFIFAILPKTEGLFKKWLNKLFSEAFFAPAYLFLMYVVISIVKGTNLAESVGTTDGNIFASTDVIKVLLNFIIIIIMMSAAIIIAKQMGAHAGGTVEGWAGKAKGFGLGLLGGATGYNLAKRLPGTLSGAVGAYGPGQLANWARNSNTVKNLDKSRTGRFINDMVLRRGLDKAADAKYGGSASFKERVEKTAGRIDQFKTPKDQYEFLNSLSEGDRKAAYKKLSDRQKAELHEYNDEQLNIATPGGTSPAIIDAARATHSKISNIGPKTGTEDYEKLEVEKKKIVDQKNIKAAIEQLKPVIPPPMPGGLPPTPGTPPPPLPAATVQPALKTLKGKNVNKLDPTTLTRGDVAPHFSIQHLAAMKEHLDMDQTHRDKIRKEIERAVGVTPTSRIPTTGSSEQQKVYNWLETGGGVEF